MHESSSTFLQHIPCPACGSRDNNALYSDGHTHCFGCGAHGSGDATDPPQPKRVPAELIQGEVRGLRARKIDDATAQHFGYAVGQHKGKVCQIAPYYNEAGELVAQKLRFEDKSFAWVGDSSAVMPFGYHAFAKSGRSVVLTEGEIDALSMSQAQKNKYPVWSIPTGAGPQVRKYIARIRDQLLQFEKVVVMFDNDEPGRAAAQVVGEILGARAHIASLPLKDANEMLKAGRVEELVKAYWGAQPYRPAGIVDLASLKDDFMRPPEPGLSYPWETLTRLTGGVRLRELIAWGAGTGAGKTDAFTQTMEHFVTVHGVKIGVFALEQAKAETATRLMGKFARKTFHVPDSGWTVEDKEEAWKTVKEGQVFLYDSFGINEWDTIKAKIEYLYHSDGVSYFFVDHLTALAASEEDEKTGLERIMAEMGSLVQQIPITIHFISHLSTPEGKSHEEGGRVMAKHFKGSRAIAFWSVFMFGMERNQQAEDPEERNTTTFRVLKDRVTGRATGETFHMKYNRDSGMLEEASATAGAFGFSGGSDSPTTNKPSDF